jgi:MraZ protein
MAFRGTFDHSLDAKNRLTVPAKFRAPLSEGAVLAKAIDRCIQVWTPRGFDVFVEEALADAPRVSDRYRKLTRYFNANSFDAELDSAGRIGLPAPLLEHAGLRKDCVVTGAGDRIEIWDREAWHAYNAQLTDDVDDISALFGS